MSSLDEIIYQNTYWPSAQFKDLLLIEIKSVSQEIHIKRIQAPKAPFLWWGGSSRLLGNSANTDTSVRHREGSGGKPPHPYPTLETNKQTYQDISNTLIYEHICGDVEQEDNVVLKTNHLLWCYLLAAPRKMQFMVCCKIFPPIHTVSFDEFFLNFFLDNIPRVIVYQPT